MEQHGGTITAKSQLGKGSCFYIMLPASCQVKDFDSVSFFFYYYLSIIIIDLHQISPIDKALQNIPENEERRKTISKIHSLQRLSPKNLDPLLVSFSPPASPMALPEETEDYIPTILSVDDDPTNQTVCIFGYYILLYG